MPFRMSCWFMDVPPIPFYGLQLAVANLFNKLNLKWNKEIREVIHSFLATAARLGGCRRFFPRLVVAFSRPVLLVARPQFLKLRQFVALDSFNQFGCLIRADVKFRSPYGLAAVAQTHQSLAVGKWRRDVTRGSSPALAGRVRRHAVFIDPTAMQCNSASLNRS